MRIYAAPCWRINGTSELTAAAKTKRTRSVALMAFLVRYGSVNASGISRDNVSI